MVWILGGNNCIGPDEITPGLELRVASARSIAHLKDTNGLTSYDAWVQSGLINGYNGTLEFLKAILKPGRDGVAVETCFENAKPTEYSYDENGEITGIKTTGEAQAIYNWYLEKKVKKMPSVTDSTNTTEVAAEKPSA